MMVGIVVGEVLYGTFVVVFVVLRVSATPFRSLSIPCASYEIVRSRTELTLLSLSFPRPTKYMVLYGEDGITLRGGFATALVTICFTSLLVPRCWFYVMVV